MVLDIGSGLAALVLYATAARLGQEIDISPIGAAGRTRSAVRERLMPGRGVYCAV